MRRLMPFESGDRFVCTKDDPWSNEKHDGISIHPDAVVDGAGVDYENGVYCEQYKCPNCGVCFKVE